ncbi:hypothetical protein C8Q78DRAFT_992696 [Trametes maxima]|nr:hypothetical protein C8Q78DRAFT_992696 [Trametes maxima]
MIPTFILTRTFAISALLSGAFSVAYAAPVASAADGIQVPYGKRSCRQMGCLFEVPTHSESTLESNIPTATVVEPVDDSISTASAAVAVVVVVPPQDVAVGPGTEAVFSVTDSSDEDVQSVSVIPSGTRHSEDRSHLPSPLVSSPQPTSQTSLFSMWPY